MAIIALAFAMLRLSRRKHCSHHNKKLGDMVPSLQYQKRSIDVEPGHALDSFDVSPSSKMFATSHLTVNLRFGRSTPVTAISRTRLVASSFPWD